MDKKTLLQLLKEKAIILKDAPSLIIEAVKSTEKAVFSEILKILRKLDTENGKISNNTKNNNLLLTVKRRIEKILKASTLNTKIDGYITNFDKVEKLNRDIYQNVIGQSIARVSLSKEKKLAIDEIVDSIKNQSVLNVQFTNPIRKTLQNAVAFQRTYSEAETELRNFIKGEGKSLGALSGYTRQIVRDGINGFDGFVNDKIRDEFELDGFMYVNSIVSTSRSNCVDLVNGVGNFKKFAIRPGVYKVEDIEEIIKSADKDKSSGFNSSVTASTFAQIRMGYQCRHQVIYFFLEDAEEIENIEPIKVS